MVDKTMTRKLKIERHEHKYIRLGCVYVCGGGEGGIKAKRVYYSW